MTQGRDQTSHAYDLAVRTRDRATQRAYRRDGERYVVAEADPGRRYNVRHCRTGTVASIGAATCDAALTQYLKTHP